MNSIFLKLVFILSVIQILISCNKDKKALVTEVIVNSFPVERKIYEKKLDIPTYLFRLGIADSLLIIINKGNPYRIHVYNPISDKLVGSFGSVGKGPGEFIFEPIYYNQFQFDQGALNLWFFDMNLKQFRLYNLELALLKKPGAIKQKILLKRQVASEHSVFYINDTCLAGSSISQKGQFYTYNPIKDTIIYFNCYPQVVDKRYKQRELDRTYEFFGNSRINQTKSKIALAYLYFNRIDIFNIREKEVLSIHVPLQGENVITDKVEINSLEAKKLGYFDVFATEKYIYALKNDCYINEITSGNYRSEIHIFNWSGNSICRYFLDSPIEYIVVDERNKTLYGGHIYTDGIVSKFELGPEIL